MPFFHIVCWNLLTFQSSPTLPTIGTMIASGKSASAPIIVPWSSPRRPIAESAAPSLSTSTAACARLVGAALQSCRSSAFSWSFISALAQWTAAKPMPSSEEREPDAEQRGSTRASTRRVSPGGSAKYATRKPIVAMTEMAKRKTTCRSALLFAFGSCVAHAVVVLRVARVLEPVGQVPAARGW